MIHGLLSVKKPCVQGEQRKKVVIFCTIVAKRIIKQCSCKIERKGGLIVINLSFSLNK